jgi:hypothetical protein
MDARKRRIKHKQQRKRGTSHCPFNLTHLDHIEHRIYINICNVVLLIRGVIARPVDQFMNTERERVHQRKDFCMFPLSKRESSSFAFSTSLDTLWESNFEWDRKSCAADSVTSIQ